MNPFEMSGLALVQAMVDGKFAHPSMADTIPMRATEAQPRPTEPMTRRFAQRRLPPWR